MQYNNVRQFFFSATGKTKKVVEEIGRHLGREAGSHDILREPLKEQEVLGSDTLAIIGVPVYSGRIPALCSARLESLKGTNTPAVAVVVYGNRDYDDALLELAQLLTKNGFLIVGAGAFIGQHSIFPGVAEARPDQNDLRRLADFAQQCGTKLERMTGGERPVQVKGNLPFKKAVSVPLKPSADRAQCSACGACSRACPTGAISKDNPPAKNKDLCISCAACIAVCPKKAQAFRGIPYKLIGMLFQRKCRRRREPVTFL